MVRLPVCVCVCVCVCVLAKRSKFMKLLYILPFWCLNIRDYSSHSSSSDEGEGEMTFITEFGGEETDTQPVATASGSSSRPLAAQDSSRNRQTPLKSREERRERSSSSRKHSSPLRLRRRSRSRSRY